MVIQHISFKHGWFYHYRVHSLKTKRLTQGLDGLKNFLLKIFQSCPNEYFTCGPRGSALKFQLPFKIQERKNHEICNLTKKGLEVNCKRFKSNHSKVQLFMLEEDNKTIAVEVPIWLKPEEIKGYKNLFSCEEPLTGHIDVLRIEKGNIWVWDYKPKAEKEKYASTQTYFYALMLSKRTRIPLNRFRCGFFDEKKSYVFQPTKNIIKEYCVQK